MNRPKLNEIPLYEALSFKPGCSITMGEGQWDLMLQLAYEDDWILLELNGNEILIKAYRKPRC